jgi:hypothetical protein
MKRLVIFAAALGAVMVMASAASAQTANPPAANPPTAVGPNFVDANGDGICDNYQMGIRQGRGPRAGRGGYGPGDGTGNQGIGPKDGTGYGPGAAAGTGICDGTGPKGKVMRRGPRR